MNLKFYLINVRFNECEDDSMPAQCSVSSIHIKLLCYLLLTLLLFHYDLIGICNIDISYQSFDCTSESRDNLTEEYSDFGQ